MTAPPRPHVVGRVFDIPAHAPFLAALARGIWTEAGGDPLRLSQAIVLLPTRRACRAIGEEFLRLADGRPTLLPRLRPLGDVDEDLVPDDDAADIAPPIAELRRRLVLARAILALPEIERGPDHAVELAGELGRLIDQIETERLDFARLKDLVPDRYAEHWRQTLDFLAILTAAWPEILAGEGAIGPAKRRNLMLEALGERWTEAPPQVPIYAAGSTGSIPATADLLAIIAGLPTGKVILPGLDRGLDEASWKLLDESHAQYGLAKLLERLGVERAQVAEWPFVSPPTAAARARTALLSEALRPAVSSDSWRRLPTISPLAVEGVQRLDCANPREEAAAIALLMRDALEQPARTAALVTPDRGLARRVKAELGRYGVVIDDSAGRPLAESPPAVFLRLIADVAAKRMAPVALLACFRHPFAAGGMKTADFRYLARRLEVGVLRGARPGEGFAGLRTALGDIQNAERRRQLEDWLAALEALFAPFLDLLARDASVGELVRAHIALAESLAATDKESGAIRLWAQDAGEELAQFIDDLAGAAGDFPSIPGAAYPRFFEACLVGRVLRPRYGSHPRLQILGPLEARFIAADLTIVGGLNEGTWPPEPPPDPWMSRPMRADFGLPGLERRIGLSAHDFAQLVGAGSVVLTRAARVDGVPTVPSRWLMRLDAVLSAAGGGKPLTFTSPDVARWRNRLDAGPRVRLADPPAPRPPVSARPRKLPVTAIETWLRDPYAIYAQRILNLRALDPLEADPDAATRGSFIHQALDEFVRTYRERLPDDAAEELLRMGRARFAPILSRPGVRAFWWPRFEAVARWFVDHERIRRRVALPLAAEVTGEMTLSGGSFVLTAKADRIDRLAAGGLAIVDYKTGRVPTKPELEYGYAPQLALEAAIVAGGEFEGVAREAVESLEYWRLSGGNPAGEVSLLQEKLGDSASALGAKALDGLDRLVTRFDRAETPYHARPRPQFAPRFSDYEHLARVKEWADELEDERP